MHIKLHLGPVGVEFDTFIQNIVQISTDLVISSRKRAAPTG